MIRSGLVQYGATWNPSWSLHTGTGDREFQSDDITFEPPFATAPRGVVLALAGVDSSHLTNLRVGLYPYDVEAHEFNIRVKAWGDTEIYSVWVAWIAYDD